jgi:hypothetical protein
MRYRFLVLISILLLCASITPVFSQWANYRVLSARTNFQPALAVLGDKLYLAWTDLSFKVNIMSASSIYGFDPANRVLISDTAATEGPSMTLSEACAPSTLYLSYPTQDGVALAKTANGISWDQKTSSSIKPNRAVTIVDGFIAEARLPDNQPRRSSYDCDLSLGTSSSCFLPIIGCDVRASGPLAWARAGSTDVKAMTRGDNRQIMYSITDGPLTTLNLGGGNEWSQRGPVAAIDPDSKDPYLLWTGAEDRFNLVNLKTRQKLVLSDWSTRTPAMVVFAGQIVMAWRGGNGRDGRIVVASMPLLQSTDPGFTFDLSPPQLTIEPGQSATYTVSLRGLNGFNGPVQVRVSNDLPSGFTAELSGPNPMLPGGPPATLTVHSPGYDTAQFGSFNIKIEGSAENVAPQVGLAIVNLINLRSPGSLCFDRSSGYAGIDNYTMTIANGAAMRIDLRFTKEDIKTSATASFEVRAWPPDGLDANGQTTVALARELADFGLIGRYTYQSFKNTRAPEDAWIDVPQTDTCGKFTIYWPKPTSLQISSQEVKAGDTYTITVGNAANLSLDIVQSFNGTDRMPFTRHANAQGAIDIKIPCAEMPGTYRFTMIKNSDDTCDSGPCSGDSAWFRPPDGSNSIRVTEPPPNCTDQP